MGSWPGGQAPDYGDSGQQDAWGASGATAGAARERIQPPPQVDQPPAAQFGYGQQPGALARPATWAAPYAATRQAGAGVVWTSSNGMAVASLALGVTSIVFCWWGILAVLQVVLAIVFGFVGLSRANQGAGQSTLAIAGIICACAGLVLYFIVGLLTFGVGLII